MLSQIYLLILVNPQSMLKKGHSNKEHTETFDKPPEQTFHCSHNSSCSSHIGFLLSKILRHLLINIALTLPILQVRPLAHADLSYGTHLWLQQTSCAILFIVLLHQAIYYSGSVLPYYIYNYITLFLFCQVFFEKI